MTELVTRVMDAMCALYAGDARRIQHFTKVHAYAARIPLGEGLCEADRERVEIAALTHDIGIHLCEELFNGRCDGKLQEQEGPALAEPLLADLGVAPAVRDRVCFLIAHHHTYTGVDGLDWRILLEADFLVNGLEDGMGREALCNGYHRIFETKTGRQLFTWMFGMTL